MNNEVDGKITFQDAANLIYAQSGKKDDEIMGLLGRIEDDTRNLVDTGFSNKDKYDILVSVEYLFARARVVVEFELIKVKKILNDTNTPPALKPFFTKRSVFLAEISAKLTLIRDDLNVLQRMQWSTSTNQIK